MTLTVGMLSSDESAVSLGANTTMSSLLEPQNISRTYGGSQNWFGAVSFGSFAALSGMPVQERREVASRHYLAVEVGEACQLKCRHCIYGRPNPPRGRPAAIVRERVAEAFAEGFDPNWVSFAGKEATLFPRQLFELAATTNRPERLNILMTNGLRLEGALLHDAQQLFQQFDISLDGDREAHDWMRGPGTFDRTWRNVERVVENGNVPVGVIATAVNAMTVEGKRQVDDVLALATRLATTFGRHAGVSLSVSLYFGPPGDTFLLKQSHIIRLVSGLAELELRSRVLLTANYAHLWGYVAEDLGVPAGADEIDLATGIPIRRVGSTEVVLFNQADAPQVAVRLANDGHVYLGCNHLVLGDDASKYALGHLDTHSVRDLVDAVSSGAHEYARATLASPEACLKCVMRSACRDGDRLSGFYFTSDGADPFCPKLSH